MMNDVLHMDIAQQCDAYMAALKDPQARLYAEVITRGLHVSKAAVALLRAMDKELGTEESELQVYTDLLTEFGRHYDGMLTVTQGLDAKQGGSGLGTKGGLPGTEAQICRRRRRQGGLVLLLGLFRAQVRI